MAPGYPMQSGRGERGRRGEEIAAAYLRLTGMRILERNLRVGHKEIDLLARDGDCLVFVEVRLRASTRCGRAAESLVAAKQRTLRAAIREMVRRRAWQGDYRLDFLALDWRPGQGRLSIEHFRGL